MKKKQKKTIFTIGSDCLHIDPHSSLNHNNFTNWQTFSKQFNMISHSFSDVHNICYVLRCTSVSVASLTHRWSIVIFSIIPNYAAANQLFSFYIANKTILARRRRSEKIIEDEERERRRENPSRVFEYRLALTSLWTISYTFSSLIFFFSCSFSYFCIFFFNKSLSKLTVFFSPPIKHFSQSSVLLRLVHSPFINSFKPILGSNFCIKWLWKFVYSFLSSKSREREREKERIKKNMSEPWSEYVTQAYHLC